MTTALFLASILGTWIVCAIANHFVAGGYLRTKGENLATKEDLRDIVNQTGQIVKVTKKIEAEIFGDLWDRQKRWELKRDVLLQAMTVLADLQQVLREVATIQNIESDAPEFHAYRRGRNERYIAAFSKFQHSIYAVSLVSNAALIQEYAAVEEAVLLIGRGLVGDDKSIFKRMEEDLILKVYKLLDVLRAELGIAPRVHDPKS